MTRGLYRFGLAHANTFVVCVFLAAYLLFQIEPLIGKFILPWFGGSPAVWTTCVLFFQLLVFAGYTYAHLSLHFFSAKNQSLMHLVLLILALTLLPITPSASGKPTDASQPILSILLLLINSVGLPFFVLASTSPLLQAWYVRIYPSHSPYKLYALSNIGSFLALLSYPFLFEPFFKLDDQTLGWSIGFAGFVLVCGGLSWSFRQLANKGQVCAVPIAADGERLLSEDLSGHWRWFFWLALPTVTSILLLAITNQLCQDVASIPFLWILPLGLYLISFVLCFAETRWYRRHWIIPMAMLSTLGIVASLYWGGEISLISQILLYCLGLFFCCMLGHGELFRLRPQPTSLTAYYLAISAGGVLGGLFVALVSPLIFTHYYELHIGLLACFGLLVAVIALDQRYPIGSCSSNTYWGLASTGLIGLFVALSFHVYQLSASQLQISRNFYGVLRIVERDSDQPELARRVLRHGAIDHGFQYLDPAKQNLPTAYYRPQTGVGLAMRYFPRQDHRRIGIVGLGVGTLLSYGREGDYFRIYDINPQVVALAQNSFSFLKSTLARYEIVTADARLALERDTNQDFDILVLDAFSGDAIPMHLLTQEALALYIRHLQPDGVLAVHISNRHLNLEPLLRGLARQQGLAFRVVRGRVMDDDFGLYRSDWAYLTNNLTFLKQEAIVSNLDQEAENGRMVIWRDDFSNLYSLLK